METTVGQLVAERPGRGRVLEKHGIDYCCGGKKTLGEACREQHLAPAAILAELDAAAADLEADSLDWLNRPLAELADNIVLTHHALLRVALPRLSFLIEKVDHVHGKRHPELEILTGLFAELRTELEQHTEKEEQILFPLCKELEAGSNTSGWPYRHPCGQQHEKPRQLLICRIVTVMEREHEKAGQALLAIRGLTDDYEPPLDACPTYRVMLDSLSELEGDLHRHIHKENNILFPRAITMESQRTVESGQ